MNLKLLILSALLLTPPAFAAQWKLSHEMDISDTRKICVYQDKDGNTKQVEQSKSQYCRTYL